MVQGSGFGIRDSGLGIGDNLVPTLRRGTLFSLNGNSNQLVGEQIAIFPRLYPGPLMILVLWKLKYFGHQIAIFPRLGM
jgi:hypothetical protein